MPMSAVKGSGGVFIINPDDPEYSTTDTAYGNKVKEALLSGKSVWRYGMLNNVQIYDQILSFEISENTKGHIIALYCIGPDGSPQRYTFRITVD